MKKLISLWIILLMLFSVSYAESDIRVYYNNSEIVTEAPIINESGRIYMPLRDFFEGIGSEVSWDAATREVSVTRNLSEIKLYLNSNISYINGIPTNLETPPKIVDDLTYVPLRFLSESFGMEVYWNDFYKNVYLNENLSEYTYEIHRYKGQILDGKPHGFAKKYDINGNLKYEGYFFNGNRSGIGTQYWSNGDVCHGTFINDNINGEGKMIYKDRGTYIGKFLNGKRDGDGKFTWINGETYEGQWKDDKINGTGTYIFKNKDKYIGSWTNNKMNGQGYYYFSNGKIFGGTWDNGKQIGGSYK
ncbi:stalk domain-containing protein [Tissierella sp.]|uniref:stalk domain-containing protein n=1 Tax=Tissierella sp. TaxID=41274 RepID=UPI0028A8FFAC|nr:stalk domain-containing protein [Tissierella sp.]